jgi:ribonuclease R
MPKKRHTLREQINQQADTLLGWFRRTAPKEGVSAEHIALAMGMTGAIERAMLGQALDKLCSKKVLHLDQGGQYTLSNRAVDAAPTAASQGILAKMEFTHSGLAFANSVEGDRSWLVQGDHLRRALPGDLVRILPSTLLGGKQGRGGKARKNQGPVGREKAVVLEVVERARQFFVGIVRRKGSKWFLDPDLKGFEGWMELLPSKEPVLGPELALEQAEGMKAVVRWLGWTEEASSPQVELAEWLGSPGDHHTEMAAIGVEFGFSLHFGPKAVDEASQCAMVPTKEDLAGRRDFRGVTTLTIDPADAKDFDDAISIRDLGEDCWEIGVHIADVSHYVRPGTALDQEAAERATSVYMVHQVLPMLPENLSNLVCSLRPEEDKLCYSAVFETDSKAAIRSTWVGRTCIRSQKRFSYEEAQEVLDAGTGPWHGSLQVLDRIATSLRHRRFEAGALDFDTEELRFVLDATGFPLEVKVKERKPAHRLIEDWMLLANRAVAEKLSAAVREGLIPASVYRVHDFPDPERLNRLADFAQRLGYQISVKSRSQIAASLHRLIQDSEGQPEAEILQQMAIRSMAKAVYTVRNIGHYGLAFTQYTHFTSPIRRYPDLLVHRLLANLDGSAPPQPYSEEHLFKLCYHDSEKERSAAMAERAAVRFKQLQMLSVRPEEVWEGMISSVGEQGAWVSLDYNRCDGLLPLSSLPDGRYYYDADEIALIGSYRGQRLDLGQRVKVEIAKLDLKLRRLEFRWHRDEDAPR